MIRKIPINKINIVVDTNDYIIDSNGKATLVYYHKNYIIFDDNDDILNLPICNYCHSLTSPNRLGNCNNCGAPVK